MDLRNDAEAMRGELNQLREALHREPEIGLTLPRTQEKVLAALAGLPLEISQGSSTTSVTAVLRGTAPTRTDGSPVVLLRGDMDGLPVQESSGGGLHLADRRRHARLRARPAHRHAGRCRRSAQRAPRPVGR